MSSVAHKLITAEEYWQSPMNTKRSDLVRGRVIETPIQGAQHGEIVATVAALLHEWAYSSAYGCVCARAGYVLTYNPDTVLGPDISYVRTDRIPSSGVPEGFWPIAPDLAIEVISASDTKDEIEHKVRYFLAAGTPLVWTIYPDEREVVAHTPDGLVRTYSEDAVLEHPDVLPGFSCKVAELFV